jgi:hypothetical protein
MYRLLLALVRSFFITSADATADVEIAPAQEDRTASESRRYGAELTRNEQPRGVDPRAVTGIVTIGGAVPADQPGRLVYGNSGSEIFAAQVPPAVSQSERFAYYATAPPLGGPCNGLLRLPRRLRPALRSDGRKPRHRAGLEQRCGRAFGPVQPHYRSDRMPVLGRLSVGTQAERSLTGLQEVIQCSTS